MQFVGRSGAADGGQILQIEIGAALDGGAGGSLDAGHHRISGVERSICSAFGKARAIASRGEVTQPEASMMHRCESYRPMAVSTSA